MDGHLVSLEAEPRFTVHSDTIPSVPPILLNIYKENIPHYFIANLIHSLKLICVLNTSPITEINYSTI